MFAWIVSCFFGIISIFSSLAIKSELEKQVNRKQSIFLFHLFNFLISNGVFTATYIVFQGLIDNKVFIKFYVHFFKMLPFFLLVYFLCHILFLKYLIYKQKYIVSPDRKVLFIKETYLRKKK
jgi:hypothetical protein